MTRARRPSDRPPGVPSAGPIRPRPRALSVLAAAEEAPFRVAVIIEGGALTYRELARQVAGAIEELRARGAGPGAPVAVVAERRLDSIVAILALLELGAPAALLHPRLHQAERATLLDDVFPRLPHGRILGPSWKRPAPRDPPSTEPRALDARAAAVVFTSGSSGRARAVQLSRRALAASAAASAAHLGWQPDDRWHALLPLSHVGGLAILVRCLAARRTVVVEPEGRFDATAIAASMDRHAVTLASAVPAMLHDLVEAGAKAPASLRALLLGGAAAPPAQLERAVRAGWPVLTTYGMSETASQIATWPPSFALDPARGVGLPLPGVEIAIRDGRIFVRGDVLMTRYLPTPDGVGPAGDEGFAPDGFFDTGDRGTLAADGFLRVCGRADDTIITGGENVDPIEVEAELCRSCRVAAAVVVGIPDTRLGELIAAAVLPTPNADLAALARELQVLARDRLAPYKRPRRVEIWPDLALTSTGKPDRRAARIRLQGAAAVAP